MNARTILGLLLLGVGLAAHVYFNAGWVFTIGAGAIALLGAIGLVRLQITPGRRYVYGALFAAAFVVKWQFAPVAPPDSRVFLLSFGPVLTQIFLALQAVQFVVRSERGLPDSFPLFGIVALTAAGDIFSVTGGHEMYQWFALAYVGLAALFYGAGSRQPTGLRTAVAHVFAPMPIVVLAVMLGVAMAMSAALRSNQQRLDDAFVQLIGEMRELPNRAGLSVTPRLGSVTKQRQSNSLKVLYRIESEIAPSYLRARVFDELERSTWAADPASRAVPRAQAPEDAPAWAQFAYSLRDRGAKPTEVLDVWPEDASDEVMPAPLGTIRVELEDEELYRDANYALRPPPLRNDPYRLIVEDTYSVADAPGDMGRYLQIPAALSPDVLLRSASITMNVDSTEEKVARIIRYLHENHRYDMGIEIPIGRDPIEYFILEREDAHCEYFATAAALFLRLADVPARYVTGYVAAEQNPVDDTWIVRNEAAHAWVEAYDPDRGWFIVEATPADGLPSVSEIPASEYRRDAWRQWWRRVKHAVMDLRYSDVLSGAALFVWSVGRWLITTPLGWALLGVAVLAATMMVRRRRRGRAVPSAQDPHARLHQLRESIDALLGQRGLERSPSETPRTFADRLQTEGEANDLAASVAGWYADYASLRYRPGPLDERAYLRLKTRAEELTATRA